MTVRRATPKERSKYGKEWISRRSRPIIPSTPPPAPWSVEAIEAADAIARARRLPPLMAHSLRRIERGALRVIFDLYVPHWHVTLRDCLWFVKPRSEWVELPKRNWTDRSGKTHYEDTI